jgi:Calcineurin-like phosphoesterase
VNPTNSTRARLRSLLCRPCPVATEEVGRESEVGEAERAIAHEVRVTDALAADVQSGGLNGPAFFFHLGDVIYNFGEAQYYYDQLYEPFRNYDRPIFAVPGNRDGMVFGQGSSVPSIPTLRAFLANFCAAAPGPSPDSGGLVRSVMTQPGVYFTLDAPFASIIGLYSNVLDGPPGGHHFFPGRAFSHRG